MPFPFLWPCIFTINFCKKKNLLSRKSHKLIHHENSYKYSMCLITTRICFLSIDQGFHLVKSEFVVKNYVCVNIVLYMYELSNNTYTIYKYVHVIKQLTREDLLFGANEISQLSEHILFLPSFFPASSLDWSTDAPSSRSN